MRYIVALSFVAVLALAGGALVLRAQEAVPVEPATSAPVVEPSDESAEIIEEAGGVDSGMAETPVGPRLVVDGEVVPTADAVDAVETVEGSAGILKWAHFLIPLLVLLSIAGLTALSDRIPGHLKLLIAPTLGYLADAAGAWASGTHANPVIGAIAGALAVYLHQFYKQWRDRKLPKAVTP